MATPIPTNSARFTAEEIARETAGTLVRGGSTVSTGVVIDSRAVTPGSLFVAVRGEAQDGGRYLPQAITAGASIVLVHPGTVVPDGPAVIEVRDTTRALGDLARAFRLRWGGKVVAITGSAGKTTTKELTAAAFAGLGARVLKTRGNLNNQFGVPMTLFGLERDHDLAVLEVGTSGRGEIARLGEIVVPDVAVVLLAALAHTQGIGTLADVAEEKSSLFRALGSKGIAVVNADDPELASRTRKDVRTLSFGTGEGADVQLVSSKLALDGTKVKLHARGTEHQLTLGLLGHAAAIDSAAALCAVIALHGEDAIEPALAGLATCQPTAGRMSLRKGPSGVALIDDSYNANPGSMGLGLETLKELAEQAGGRAIAVIGDMKELGTVSAREHAKLGELAVRLGIDVLVGAGPEMAHATSAAARLSGGRLAPHPTRVVHVMQPLDAVSIVKSLWREHDVVLVKGSRGMAMERVLEALADGADA